MKPLSKRREPLQTTLEQPQRKLNFSNRRLRRSSLRNSLRNGGRAAVALLGLAALVGCGDSPVSSGGSESPPLSGSTWSEKQKLLVNDRATNDRFGNALALSGDTLVVGAYGKSSVGESSEGAAYVFTISSSNWSEKAKLTASDRQSNDYFGSSVALSSNTIAVGAYKEDSGGKDNNGAVYVFTRSGGSWNQQAKLTAKDGESADHFGQSVAVVGDTIAVGAYGEDSDGRIDNGAVYVFTRSGDSWSEQAKLTASDKESEDKFGVSVALSGDTLAVGVPEEKGNSGLDNGAVYVFTRSGGLNGTWNQQAKLTAKDGESADHFGQSVAVVGDTIAVGAYGEDSGGRENNGAVYIFTRSGGLNGTWSEQAKLTASDKQADDYFGYSVALSGDTLAVGAYGRDQEGIRIRYKGIAYLFTHSGGIWRQQAQLTAKDRKFGDRFGHSIGLSEGTTAVGAPYESSGEKRSGGAVYLFKQ